MSIKETTRNWLLAHPEMKADGGYLSRSPTQCCLWGAVALAHGIGVRGAGGMLYCGGFSSNPTSIRTHLSLESNIITNLMSKFDDAVEDGISLLEAVEWLPD